MKKGMLSTSGVGFLSLYLCERLLKEDNEVIYVGNFFTGNKANIAHFLDNPYFEIQRYVAAFSFYVFAETAIVDMAKKEMDCKLHMQLDDGLKKTITYFKSIM